LRSEETVSLLLEFVLSPHPDKKMLFYSLQRRWTKYRQNTKSLQDLKPHWQF